MEDEIVLVQARIRQSVVTRIKEAGYGRFTVGLYVLLDKLDEARGTVEKHDDQIASKGVRKSEFKADPRLPRQPGEHQAKYNARLTAYIANLPETRNRKIHDQLEHYIKGFYHLHRGIIDETTMFETQIFDAKGNHLVGAGEDVRIMEYITPDELNAWMPESVANDKASRSQPSIPPKQRTQTKQLTPEALLGYGFKRTPPDMPDEAIEAINAEWAPGGEHYGDDPIREMEK